MSIKLCIRCFHKHFGEDASIKVLTWARECHECRTPTPNLGLLIKCDLIDTFAR